MHNTPAHAACKNVEYLYIYIYIYIYIYGFKNYEVYDEMAMIPGFTSHQKPVKHCKGGGKQLLAKNVLLEVMLAVSKAITFEEILKLTPVNSQ